MNTAKRNIQYPNRVWKISTYKNKSVDKWSEVKYLKLTIIKDHLLVYKFLTLIGTISICKYLLNSKDITKDSEVDSD